MININVLDQSTINKIAAGEVIERPASIVKELLENAIDAKATAITVEIKDGGTSFIRITDNGCGIEKDDIKIAFLRHSTSKIKSAEDLITVSSLGFRGEALSSISAVSQMELITKPASAMTGVRYLTEGGTEKHMEEIGVPEGTTFIVRNIFFNMPARKKFLKSNQTESGYISDIVERIALSHPEVSIRFISNNQNKLYTSGNGNIKDVIYQIFGRDIASASIHIKASGEYMQLDGYIGKPVISRGNRNYEMYYVNGRYIKSSLIAKAIEDAYKPYMMQHKYPFAVLHIAIDPVYLDVNVHPTKMEIRFENAEPVYTFISDAIKNALAHKELIPGIDVPDISISGIDKPDTRISYYNSSGKKDKLADKPPVPQDKQAYPEPFEKNRRDVMLREASGLYMRENPSPESDKSLFVPGEPEPAIRQTDKPEQMNFLQNRLLSEQSKASHMFIGQIFDTYWLVEFEQKLFMIDQHAAHEKVLFEKMMKSLELKEHTSQNLNPPIILTLSDLEEGLLKRHFDAFKKIGFEIEHFGGKEYAVRAVPDNLYAVNHKDLLIQMLDSLMLDLGTSTSEMILEKIASISCKAAVKGNQKLSLDEAKALVDALLELENPYHCPHGRPTIVSMTKYEIEKKFKRIV